MSYTFDFSKLPLRANRAAPAPAHVVEREDVATKTAEDTDIHTYTYVRASGRRPENCVAIYHTDQGEWWELDVGPESQVGQREFPQVHIRSIERISR
jgi:hypothetical protein